MRMSEKEMYKANYSPGEKCMYLKEVEMQNKGNAKQWKGNERVNHPMVKPEKKK